MMTQAPDSVIVTGPNFSQTISSNLLVTPTGGTQITLGAALAGAAGGGLYLGKLSISGPLSGSPIIRRATTTGGASGKGSGAVPVVLGATKPILYLEYQVVDATSGAVIESWQPYTGSVSPGSQTIAPLVGARLGWNLMQVRANGDNTSIVTSVVPFGVGAIIAVWGQSLALDLFAPFASSDPETLAQAGVTVNPNTAMFGSWAVEGGSDQNYPPTWSVPGDSTPYWSTSGVTLISLLANALGCNVGMIGYAVGSTPLVEWQPGRTTSPTHFPTLATILTSAGTGGIDVLLGRIGHADAKLGTPVSIMERQWVGVINGVQNLFPNNIFRRIYMTIPGLISYAPATTQTVMDVRFASKTVAANDAMGEYVDSLNAPLYVDGVHPSQAGGATDANNIYRSIARLLGIIPVGSQGPYFGGAGTRTPLVPKNIVIPVQQNGGTAFVGIGTPQNQFSAFLQSDTLYTSPLALDGTTPITISNPVQVTLTLASDPGVGSSLNVLYRPYPDTTATVASALDDNDTNGGGIAVGRQIYDQAYPIAIPASGSALTVTTPSNTTAGTAIAVSGSYFGNTPSAFDWGTDNSTWTAGTSVSVGGGSYAFSAGSGVLDGVYNLYVRDHNNLGVVGVSGVFGVTEVSPVALPTIANHVMALTPDVGLTNVFSDNAYTTQAVIGNNAGSVKDATATGNNFALLTGFSLTAPTYVGNAKNSLPAMRFTAANSNSLRIMSGAPLPPQLQTSSGWTMAAFFTIPALPAGSNFYEVIEIDVNGLGQRLRLVVLATGIVRAYMLDDTTSTTVNSPSAITAGSTVAVIWGWNGTSLQMTVNAQANQTATPASRVNAVPWADAWIGSMRTASTTWANFASMDLLELHAWNTAFTTGNASSLATYATSKWGS